jgi:hypothetical protein
MDRTEFTIETDTGAYDLTASVRMIGPDLLIAIWGGEKPHIGAVAVAQPRPHQCHCLRYLFCGT